jgi:hypothetical protein
MSKNSLPIISTVRECGSCSKCCEGWLEATIYDKKMHSGQPCFFLEKGERGCTIYPDRPKSPCVDYSCAWIEEPNVFPSWLKPNISNVIITKKTIDDTELTYYEIVEAGARLDAAVLQWIFMWALKTQTSIMYQLDGKFHTLATPQLDAAIAAVITEKNKKI